MIDSDNKFSVQEAFIGYSDYSVIPIVAGQKYPAISWQNYCKHPATSSERLEWSRKYDRIGVVCGSVSGGVSGAILETIDIDNHTDVKHGNAKENFEIFESLCKQRNINLKDFCIIEHTQSGGVHLIYRFDSPMKQTYGNQKLLRAGVLTLFETRCEGGLIVCAPTSGYTVIGERTFFDVLKPIPISVRTAMFRIIQNDINAIINPAEPAPHETDTDTAKAMRAMRQTAKPNELDGKLQALNNKLEASENNHFNLLTENGFNFVGSQGVTEFWRRPNKDKGISATFNYNGNGKFYVFSTNTEFESERFFDTLDLWSVFRYGKEFCNDTAKQCFKDFENMGISEPSKLETVTNYNLKDVAKQYDETQTEKPAPIICGLESFSDMQQAAKYPIGTKRIATGFRMLDMAINGGCLSDLIILGGTSGIGKTSFILQVAYNMAKGGTPVLYVNQENAKQSMFYKLATLSAYQQNRDKATEEIKISDMIFNLSEIDAYFICQYNVDNYFAERHIQPSKLNIETFERKEDNYLQAVKELQQLPLTFLNSRRNINNDIFVNNGNDTQTLKISIKKAINEMIDKYGKAPVIFVDYLQILQPDITLNNCSDIRLIDEAISNLREISQQYNTPVFVITSYNRSSTSTGVVSAESAKGSSSVEYSSDLLAGLCYVGSSIPTTNRTKDVAETIRSLNDYERKNSLPLRVEMKILKNRRGKSLQDLYYLFLPFYSVYVEIAPHEDTDSRYSPQRNIFEDIENEIKNREYSIFRNYQNDSLNALNGSQKQRTKIIGTLRALL